MYISDVPIFYILKQTTIINIAIKNHYFFVLYDNTTQTSIKLIKNIFIFVLFSTCRIYYKTYVFYIHVLYMILIIITYLSNFTFMDLSHLSLYHSLVKNASGMRTEIINNFLFLSNFKCCKLFVKILFWYISEQWSTATVKNGNDDGRQNVRFASIATAYVHRTIIKGTRVTVHSTSWYHRNPTCRYRWLWSCWQRYICCTYIVQI